MNEDKTISRDSKLKIKLRTSEAKRVVAVRELGEARKKLRELVFSANLTTLEIKALKEQLEELKEAVPELEESAE